MIALALIAVGTAFLPWSRLLPPVDPAPTENAETAPAAEDFSARILAEVPAYAGQPYATVNGNAPFFTEEEITARSFERYGKLDKLGRCTACTASVGRDLMPTAPRESIYEVKPTGWHSYRYDFIDGESLYNRCHLIGFQLTAENANPRNLITGTRYMNTEGMLPFENMAADHVRETGGHVMVRVTPVFAGNDLVCRGVLMEGYSVEDQGGSVYYCVFCYNVQPGVEIDYATGESRLVAALPDAA
ncbi:MAG: DNA/RNA non-specific endonuclease [Clostridia bacterium]|nr:DNA/RNA non-specific endonuclease [Clostridia bacterium]